MLRRLYKFTQQGAVAQQSDFKHADAQKYEFDSAKQTIREAYPNLLEMWKVAKQSGDLWQNADDQWFLGNRDLFTKFVEHVRDRKCLEIGSGPFGHLAPCWWIKDRVVIDPLVQQYRAYEIELFGESWFDGVTLIDSQAEETISELVGKVDGFITTRNALDHCEDWLAIMNNISEYASSGCWLLLWTDIWHLAGHDEGHHNITRSVEAMDKLLHGLGFDIVQHGQLIRKPDEFIEYGRLAIRR